MPGRYIYKYTFLLDVDHLIRPVSTLATVSTPLVFQSVASFCHWDGSIFRFFVSTLLRLRTYLLFLTYSSSCHVQVLSRRRALTLGFLAFVLRVRITALSPHGRTQYHIVGILDHFTKDQMIGSCQMYIPIIITDWVDSSF